MGARRQRPLARVGRWATVALVVVLIAAPLYWLLASSLKTPVNIGASPTQYIPNPISLANYQSAFVHYGFGRYVLNSVIVTLGATALVLVLGTLAGYAFGRLPMRGVAVVLVVLLMISVFPEIAVVPPLYLVLRQLNWLNSYQALIVPYTAFNLPFAVWILRNYFLGIPHEMEEAARVDGASTLRTVWSVILPQALPGVFTAGIFTFTACWTEFLMALTFDSSNSYRTIPVGIALFGSPTVIPFGTIFAAAVVAIVPIGILVFVFRKWVVSGLTAGAVKG
ncbi:binding-protein-dependent transport systems inner membrane component [Acidimicrobium ferrooxidans DSM 10331]|uniref:Binding-protein-dependent transport systems inner membrane component n=1 Tax=Acidimicrobium ferrooxidans (strain DSM 10331 / JCM 15462 / NBRC 103882 / ICP) TaxID=525909 RepID=C7LZU7_ACIFD|nr:carbohydrate ABC transporter permease [Acidimicrobium ferrooxidans]ACU54255.1 binding-protein-dependent transport systems inner membrane component [Acidimicrobium ferrooxidans DSM 10331]